MPDLNPQQFKTLYHGTHEKHVESIRAEGLKDPQGTYSAGWPTLTDSREQAARYANGGPVAEFHVPESAVWSRGNREGVLWPPREHGAYIDHKAQAYALKKPLPPEYLHTVHKGSKDA